jgi:histidinol-phosphate aminotransferase
MSCDFLAIANPGVQKLRPYQAGKPTSELERELGITDIVKLASNENPLGLSKKVSRALVDELAELTRYPDANGHSLKQALSDKYEVQLNQVTLGNGSNDLLELIARAFVSTEQEVIFAQYAFIVYPLVTQAIGATSVVVAAKDYGHDLDAMADAISDKTALIFIANPNNPTGNFLAPNEVKAFLAKVPENVLVVLDEAYFEYVAENLRGNAIAWINEFPNLIVTQTLSKAYGLAGIRLGICYASEEIIAVLNRIKPPYNVNQLTQDKALERLNSLEKVNKEVNQILTERKRLRKALKSISIVKKVYKSDANFLLVKVDDANKRYQQLVEKGIVVRNRTNQPLCENCLRFTVGLSHENETLIKTLKELS